MFREAQKRIIQIGDWCNDMKSTLDNWPNDNVIGAIERRCRLFIKVFIEMIDLIYQSYSGYSYSRDDRSFVENSS